MKKVNLSLILITLLLVSSCNNGSKTNKSDTNKNLIEATKEITKVTDENYGLAETQMIFNDYVSKIAKATNSNGTGVFMHNKKPLDPKDRTVMRINFDTQYSFIVLDLTEEATLTMPETNGRYQSAWFITEDHYNPMAFNKPGEYIINQENTGSKYVMIIMRTQVNMKDPTDMDIVSKLQDELKITQSDQGSYLASGQWDMKDILAMREKYQKIVSDKNISTDDMFGKKGEVNLENHNCGTAFGWGGLTKDQAVYPSYNPKTTDASTLTLEDVPVNAFWSVTIYDADGYPQGDVFNINSSFAKKNENGSVTIHFGGDKNNDNYMDIFKGWNFSLRLYQPKEDYFNGNWTKPELISVK